MAEATLGKTIGSALVGAVVTLFVTILTPWGQSTGQWIQSKAFGCRDSTAVISQLRSLEKKGTGAQVFDVNGDGVDDLLTIEPTSPALDGKLRVDLRDACNPDTPNRFSWPMKGGSTNIGYADRHWSLHEGKLWFCRKTRLGPPQEPPDLQWDCDVFSIDNRAIQSNATHETVVGETDVARLKQRLGI
jgi:hypothetical protein